MKIGFCSLSIILTAQSIMIFIFRGQHTGYVCSGWYLTKEQQYSIPYVKYVELSKGQFLYFMMIMMSIVLGAGCCVCGLAGLYIYRQSKGAAAQ